MAAYTSDGTRSLPLCLSKLCCFIGTSVVSCCAASGWGSVGHSSSNFDGSSNSGSGSACSMSSADLEYASVLGLSTGPQCSPLVGLSRAPGASEGGADPVSPLQVQVRVGCDFCRDLCPGNSVVALLVTFSAVSESEIHQTNAPRPYSVNF
jgi:hypothetical protein